MHLYCWAPFVHDKLGVAFKLLSRQLTAVGFEVPPSGFAHLADRPLGALSRVRSPARSGDCKLVHL